MSTELATGPASDQVTTKEYSVSIDGVVEVSSGIDEKTFFQGLLDAVISYVERHHAFAGLTMSHKEYSPSEEDEGDDGEASDGRQTP